MSDLRPATSSTDSSGISPTQPQRPATPPNRTRSDVSTPTRQIRPPTNYGTRSPIRGSSPAKGASPSRLTSPVRQNSPRRPITPSRKENIDPKQPQAERSPLRKKNDESGSPTQDSKRLSRATSIPRSRAIGLRERPMLLNYPDAKQPEPQINSQKPQKLRMQSPQKVCPYCFVKAIANSLH